MTFRSETYDTLEDDMQADRVSATMHRESGASQASVGQSPGFLTHPLAHPLAGSLANPSANRLAGAISYGGFAEPGGTSKFDQPPLGETPDTAPGVPVGSGRPITRAEAIAVLVGSPLADIERGVIEATILHCGGSIPQAARVLGVSASTLYRKRAAWPPAPRRSESG